MSDADKQRGAPGGGRRRDQAQGRRQRHGRRSSFSTRVEVLRVVRGLVHRAGDADRRSPSFTRHGQARRRDARSRSLELPGGTGGWELVEEDRMMRERRPPRRRGVRARGGDADDAGRARSRSSTPIAPRAHDPRDRRARDRARSRHGLRSELRRHELREGHRHRQAQVRLEALQHHRRQGPARRPRDDRLRRRRREDDEVPDRARRHPRRPLDEPRDGALHRRERKPRLHAGERRGATIRSCACRTCTSSRGRRDRRRRSRSSPTRRTACSSTAAAATRSTSSATTASSAAARSGRSRTARRRAR